MMQACVKMYTAVKQQMPALDVFINVFSSSVRQPFLTSPPFLDLNTVVTSSFAPAEVQRKGQS